MKKILIIGSGVLLALIVFFGFKLQSNAPSTLGSIGDGQAYNATSTSDWGIATVGAFKLLKSGSGVLGSVVITNATAGSFNIYDATTTVNGGQGAFYSTTTLSKIGASVAAGTYTYDVSFNKGLIIEFQSTNIASSTITWR